MLTRHEQIERVAYFLWQERGSPFGSPEIDWFRAEKRFAINDSERREAPMIVATSKKVGSVLGQIAGAVEAVVDR